MADYYDEGYGPPSSFPRHHSGRGNMAHRGNGGGRVFDDYVVARGYDGGEQQWHPPPPRGREGRPPMDRNYGQQAPPPRRGNFNNRDGRGFRGNDFRGNNNNGGYDNDRSEYGERGGGYRGTDDCQERPPRDDYNRRDGRRRERSRDRSRGRDEYPIRRRGEERDRSRQHMSRDDVDTLQPPSCTIILQNISPTLTEKMIEDRVILDGFACRHAVIPRHRESGEIRGYAFVEFNDIQAAEGWLNQNKRQYDDRVFMNFSKSKRTQTENNQPTMPSDWTCSKCKVLNFGCRRLTDKFAPCFRCGERSKGVETVDKNAKEISKVEPCHVLMVRGMDFSTTEEVIRNAITSLVSLPIFDVRLIRDKSTDMSRGFAFVEMGKVEDATSLLEAIENSSPPFEIDGRRVNAGYAKHGFNTPQAKQSKSNNRIETAASVAMAQAAQSKVNNQYLSSSSVDVSQQSSTDPAAAAISAQYNTQQYVYDATTGFYYDTVTELYYDPNSGYYYNGETGKYMYWNGTRYQAVEQSSDTAQTAATNAASVAATGATTLAHQPSTGSTEQTAENGKEKVGLMAKKPKEARKIAKDMERWAKKMNSATQAKKQAEQELRVLEAKEEALRKQMLLEKNMMNKADADTTKTEGVRSLFIPEEVDNASVLNLSSALKPQKNPGSLSMIADIPDDDDDDDDDSRYIDTTKLACLLCKRQFPSLDMLNKHQQMSQLHKDNLAKIEKK